jgi:hypothetical protein
MSPTSVRRVARAAASVAKKRFCSARVSEATRPNRSSSNAVIPISAEKLPRPPVFAVPVLPALPLAAIGCARAGIDLRQLVGATDAILRARRRDIGSRDTQVAIVRQRLVDQRLQPLVAEDLAIGDLRAARLRSGADRHRPPAMTAAPAGRAVPAWGPSSRRRSPASAMRGSARGSCLRLRRLEEKQEARAAP